jgi:membrane-associated phospholipid phosphatase/MFS family permease
MSAPAIGFRRRASLGPVVLAAFSLAAVGAGAGRALTTTYLPVLLERIEDEATLIGAVMTVNALAGFTIPIAVGIWSDRRGRRSPFIAGGALLTAGGLVAVGLGNGSSYLALALAAGLVYTGLNALTTAHRTIVADDVEDARRPAATSAQEVAGLVGAVMAVAIGGALIEPAPAAAFGIAAGVLALTTLPTLVVTRRLRLGERATGAAPAAARHVGSGERVAVRAARAGWSASVREVFRRPGARDVLLAQTSWVFAYAALPAFFVLYAEHSLGLSLGAAGALPLGFGVVTAIAIVLAGRVRPERVHGLLLTGAALLGVGLLGAAPAATLLAAVPGFVVAAFGAGLVTALGYPYFARFVPEAEAGRYSGVFFAGRSIASAAALPLAGVAVELSGSYRAVLLFGAISLLALVPLRLAHRRTMGEDHVSRPVLQARPGTVAAVIPVFTSDRALEIAKATLRHVDELVLVDDGAPEPIARSLDELAGDERVRVLRQGRNGGKGSAVAAGAAVLLADPTPPEAIVVLDSDGQHDPSRIPAFIEASREADVVIGDRTDRRAMPLGRRIARMAASLLLLGAARTWIADTQNGMRLFRTAVLRDVPLMDGGYEAESRHLRALLAARRPVASVEIATIYDGEPSHYRALVDSVRVARALSAAPHKAEPGGTAAEAFTVLRGWAPRLATLVLAAIALGAAMPIFQSLDNMLYLAINGLGDGPEWLYQVLDPHTRNYVLLTATTVLTAAIVLRRPRHVLGAALAVVLAAYFAGAALEIVKLFIERARPEEVLGGQVQLSHGRSWSHLASYPSGHLIVTTAMAAAAASALPVLRRPLFAYVALVALTRVTFGAHFPLDVLVGAVLGYEFGVFSARLMASARLLPAVHAGVRSHTGTVEPAGVRTVP